AAPANLAFGLELLQGLPTFLDVFRRFRPVNLVQVDDVDLQPPQTRFALPADAVRAEAFADLTVLIPNPRTLGEHVRTTLGRQTSQGFGHDFLRVSQSIDGGGIDPVDPAVERLVNRGNGIGILLRPPAK